VLDVPRRQLAPRRRVEELFLDGRVDRQLTHDVAHDPAAENVIRHARRLPAE
jgi:hypothetical protein